MTIRDKRKNHKEDINKRNTNITSNILYRISMLLDKIPL